ncbi:lipocalin-like domain-containing protein [Sphingomonas sp. DT-204]|uniref:lipocalin-like domain-containing protein n=1 Tax=Sphingomonas sp. DT-204 TaxID=3396166 RepID=UPI003F1A0472
MPMSLAILAAAAISGTDQPLQLAGTWEMVSAYEILADGRRITTYGEHPNGLLMIDRAGRYSLQIFRPTRARFATGDKTRGSADEYREAVLGSSTHFGRVAVDVAHHQLVFDVEAASFPNWEERRQVRDYSYRDGLLRYAVPASASGNGTIAWSIWRKVK